MLFPKLQAADTEQRFAVWLDKLVLIDQERVVAYLREQWGSLNRVRRICARLRLGRDVADLPLE